MRDELFRVHLKGPELLAVAVVCTETARAARRMHHLMPTSASLFAEGLTAGLGVAGLLGGARINLQLTCDGPVKNLFIDADAEGRARGYIKNPSVNFLDGEEPFEPRAALGGSGLLSVLRELKANEFYRGAIALEHFDLARDLERYYRESEQIETAVRLDLRPEGDEPLGRTAGLFVQLLPDAEPSALERVRAALPGRMLGDWGADAGRALDLIRPLAALFPECETEVLADYPVAYHCGCSPERVVRAVLAMGREEIKDMIATEGKATATCAFCGAVYELPGEQLEKLLQATEPDEDDEPAGEPN